VKYKVTKQYLKAKETLLATFHDVHDAHLFVEKKISIDEEERRKVVYRLYDDFDLLQVFNKEIPFTLEADDAENYDGVQFKFQVTYQPANTSEQSTLACFNTKDDANLFAFSKCSSSPVDDLYFIYKEGILIDTINKQIVATRSSLKEGSTGNTKGATFRPSPLSTRPTPPGGPGDCWVEDDSND
jgi:hypothetical protein